jgi:hypothetical protein
MRFARWVFALAGIGGLAALFPLFFLEDWIGRAHPPAITHPEYFYGFVAVALSWQVVFVLIARDPVRYRPLMLVALLEKVPFGLAMIVLFAQGRLSGDMLAAGCIDLTWAALFLVAYLRGVPGSTE